MTSSNVAALLKIKILSWSQETGLPVCIRVRIAERSFNLHKVPLSRKSGYFREKLKDDDRNEVELPPNFPGGAETFEMMALLMYGHSGSSTLVAAANVAALRCAAEFLEMSPLVCEGLDMYLNQVVLQTWKETVTVLQSCQMLNPWAEDVLMVSRCIETVAFMACMEILDPERRREQPLLALSWPWSHAMVGDMMSRDAWIKDVIALPLAFFKRVIASLRRQGMKEKYVSTIILLYSYAPKSSSSSSSSRQLQEVIDLLPANGRVIPVGFYLSLLATSVELGLRNESVEKLRNQIASTLHLAQPQDLLLPQDGIELSLMESIFMDSDTTSPAVAQLWDLYLTVIATDPDLPCNRFISLIQTLPLSSRHTHDHLYAALNAFFHSHPSLSQEEKGLVCKYLDCNKLSRPVCIEAVRNEVMPLRLMVQALFVHHLNTTTTTQQSFRESSGTLSTPLGLLLHKEDSSDYESTSFRIENLEKELMSLKRTLELQQISKRKHHQKPVPTRMIYQVTSCIGSVNFASQRKYANRLLKILQRLTLFGGGRSKRNTAASVAAVN